MWKEKISVSPKTAKEFISLYDNYKQKHKFSNGLKVKIFGKWYDYSGVSALTQEEPFIIITSKENLPFGKKREGTNDYEVRFGDIQITEMKSNPNAKFLGISGGIILAIGLGFGIYKLIKK